MAAIPVVVKSMAGKEFQLSDLTLASTVGTLKGLVHKRDDKFVPDSTRLLFKGKELADDAQTLEAAGVAGVAGGQPAQFYVVLRLQGRAGGPVSPQHSSSTLTSPLGSSSSRSLTGNPPATAPSGAFQQPPPPQRHASLQRQASSNQAFTGQAEGGIMRAQVPNNHLPGVPLRLQVPGRGVMQVGVPAGVRPGGTFTFRVPPQQGGGAGGASAPYGSAAYHSSYAAQQQRMGAQQQQAAAGGTQLLTVAATVPGGQTMRVQVAGKGTMQVTVPQGVRVGQEFRFRV